MRSEKLAWKREWERMRMNCHNIKHKIKINIYGHTNEFHWLLYKITFLHGGKSFVSYIALLMSRYLIIFISIGQFLFVSPIIYLLYYTF